MEEFVRKVGGGFRHCQVYTQTEADERGLAYRADWKGVCSPGEWGLTDDGFVVECLGVRTYKDKKGRTRTLYRYTIARIWAVKGARLTWLDRRHLADRTSMKPGSWAARECRRARLRNAVHIYCVMVLSRGAVDWQELGVIYRRDQRIPAASVKRVFKQPEVQALIQQEFAKLMVTNGLTPQYIIGKMKEAMDTAHIKGDARSMLQAIQMISDYLGLSPSADPKRIPGKSTEYDLVESAYEQELLDAEADNVPLLPEAPVDTPPGDGDPDA